MTHSTAKPAISEAETKRLLAELDALFIKPTKKANSTSHQKGQVVKPLSEGAIANRLARALTPDFRPVAHVTLLQVQSCRCCGSTVRAIGGEFTRYESPKRLARIQRFFDPNLSLPRLVETAEVRVERCAECLLLDGDIEGIVEALDCQSRQQKLF